VLSTRTRFTDAFASDRVPARRPDIDPVELGIVDVENPVRGHAACHDWDEAESEGVAARDEAIDGAGIALTPARQGSA
jgi:hypothetical protein